MGQRVIYIYIYIYIYLTLIKFREHWTVSNWKNKDIKYKN
jgi:hypothetical protein